jgi:hypothetical protein
MKTENPTFCPVFFAPGYGHIDHITRDGPLHEQDLSIQLRQRSTLCRISTDLDTLNDPVTLFTHLANVNPSGQLTTMQTEHPISVVRLLTYVGEFYI